MTDVREELNRLADRRDHLDGHDAEERDEIEAIMRDLRSLAARGAVPEALKYPGRATGTGLNHDYIKGWNACRDAMLAAAPQPAGEVQHVYKRCGMCGFFGEEDPIEGCPRCGWDEMRDTTPSEPTPSAPADVEALARQAIEARNAWLDKNPGDAVGGMIAALELARRLSAPAAVTQAPAGVEALARLIADDGFACTFQSMGQYRSALLREVRRLSAPAAVKDFLTTADVEALGKAIFEAHREQCVGTSLWPMRGWDEVEQSTRDHWTHIARRLSGAQQAEPEAP